MNIERWSLLVETIGTTITGYRVFGNVYPDQIRPKYSPPRAWKLGRGIYYYDAEQSFFSHLRSTGSKQFVFGVGLSGTLQFNSLIKLTIKDVVGLDKVDPLYNRTTVNITRYGAHKLHIQPGPISAPNIEIPPNSDGIWFQPIGEILSTHNVEFVPRFLYVAFPQQMDDQAYSIKEMCSGNIRYFRPSWKSGDKKMVVLPQLGKWIVKLPISQIKKASDMLRYYSEQPESKTIDQFQATARTKYPEKLADYISRVDTFD